MTLKLNNEFQVLCLASKKTFIARVDIIVFAKISLENVLNLRMFLLIQIIYYF